MAIHKYGDLDPQTAAYVQVQLLRRGLPYLILEVFGQSHPIPPNSTKSCVWTKYLAIDSTPNYLQEGVTPASKNMTNVKVTADLEQVGDLFEFTDVLLDTHEDPVFQEGMDILGEQAAQMIERIRYGRLIAGVNVFYADGVARNEVVSVFYRQLQRSATKFLKRQNASKFFRVLRSDVRWGTQNIKPTYVGLCHTDLENDLYDAEGWKHVEDYGQGTGFDNEIGAIESVRYLTSTMFEPWEDAGGAAAGTQSTTGTDADVFPILWIARDAYGIVPFKGREALHPMAVYPKPSASDPLAQRGYLGWKAYQATQILQEQWITRGEVAVSA